MRYDSFSIRRVCGLYRGRCPRLLNSFPCGKKNSLPARKTIHSLRRELDSLRYEIGTLLDFFTSHNCDIVSRSSRGPEIEQDPERKEAMRPICFITFPLF